MKFLIASIILLTAVVASGIEVIVRGSVWANKLEWEEEHASKIDAAVAKVPDFWTFATSATSPGHAVFRVLEDIKPEAIALAEAVKAALVSNEGILTEALGSDCASAFLGAGVSTRRIIDAVGKLALNSKVRAILGTCARTAILDCELIKHAVAAFEGGFIERLQMGASLLGSVRETFGTELGKLPGEEGTEIMATITSVFAPATEIATVASCLRDRKVPALVGVVKIAVAMRNDAAVVSALRRLILAVLGSKSLPDVVEFVSTQVPSFPFACQSRSEDSFETELCRLVAIASLHRHLLSYTTSRPASKLVPKWTELANTQFQEELAEFVTRSRGTVANDFDLALDLAVVKFSEII